MGRRPLDLLPSYAWDDRLNNYIDLSTGRMVGREAVTELLRDLTFNSQSRMTQLGEWASTPGGTSPQQFYESMREEIKRATNANAALAKGGWHQMTPADWGANGAHLRQEYDRLAEFTRAIADGELSEKQIIARAELYANNTYQRYWDIKTEQETQRGRNEERLVTSGDDRVCEICLGIEADGYQPIGTLSIPVHPGCRCAKRYRKNE